MNSRTACRGAMQCLGAIAVCMVLSVPSRAMDDAQVIRDFQSRIDGYMEVHKKQTSASKSTESPAKLAEERRQSVDKMKAARAAAKQGDIFTPEIAAYFQKQISATLKGADGAKVRASLRHAEPVRPVPLRVNTRYPQNVPLQSTPPTLLLNLPRLPSELHYRIVGRALVLHDVPLNLIVDFVPDAIPAS